jgi:hypothetical protein
MKYNNTQGLNFEIDKCDTKPINDSIRDYFVNTTCKCNSCQNACKYEINTTFPVLKGFSVTFVGIFYTTVFLLTIAIHFFKRMCRSSNSTSNIETRETMGTHLDLTRNSVQPINLNKTPAENI